MKISKELAANIIKGLYIPAGESGCIHFPRSKMVYTWSYMAASDEYFIFSAKRTQLEKYGCLAPVRVIDHESRMLDFTNMEYSYCFDAWKPVASFARKELFQ